MDDFYWGALWPFYGGTINISFFFLQSSHFLNCCNTVDFKDNLVKAAFEVKVAGHSIHHCVLALEMLPLC